MWGGPFGEPINASFQNGSCGGGLREKNAETERRHHIAMEPDPSSDVCSWGVLRPAAAQGGVFMRR